MNAVTRIAVGALLVVLGAFTSLTFVNELLALVKGAIGPLLVLVGAFIVWLESDELKLEQSQKKQKSEEGLKREFRPQEDQEQESMEYQNILDGTVEEVKQTVQQREDFTQSDFRKLIEKEQTGKDRKTVKEFLKRRID
jgi:hypothetical protein